MCDHHVVFCRLKIGGQAEKQQGAGITRIHFVDWNCFQKCQSLEENPAASLRGNCAGGTQKNYYLFKGI